VKVISHPPKRAQVEDISEQSWEKWGHKYYGTKESDRGGETSEFLDLQSTYNCRLLAVAVVRS
jgi:hypothetical protein